MVAVMEGGMRWILLCALALATTVTVTVLGALPARAQMLADVLAEEYYEQFRQKPNHYLEAAGNVILGYGTNGAIDAQGIENLISVRRSVSRAGIIRRLLVADLNNDAKVTRAEVGIVVPTLAASLRSRLVMIHRQADKDADGTVSAAELRSYGDVQARRSLSEREAEDYRRLMMLDSNGDGWVTLDEAQTMIDKFRAKAANGA